MTEFHYLALAFLSIGLIISGGGALVAYLAHRDDLKQKSQDFESKMLSRSRDV